MHCHNHQNITMDCIASQMDNCQNHPAEEIYQNQSITQYQNNKSIDIAKLQNNVTIIITGSPWIDLRSINIPESMIASQRIVLIDVINRMITSIRIANIVTRISVIGLRGHLDTMRGYLADNCIHTSSSELSALARILRTNDQKIQDGVDRAANHQRMIQMYGGVGQTTRQHGRVGNDTRTDTVYYYRDWGAYRRLRVIPFETEFPDNEVTNDDPFWRTREISIDPMNITIQDFLLLFKSYEDVKIIAFCYKDRLNHGVGNGADRHCRTIMLKRIIEHYFNVIDHWWIEPRWDILLNHLSLEPLIGYIRSCIELKILLPWHFTPRIIELIVSRSLTNKELMHFLEHIDPDIYRSINKINGTMISDEEFRSFSPGHDSLGCMIRERIMGRPKVTPGSEGRELNESEKQIIHRFDFGPLVYADTIEFDQKISEPYVLSNQMIVDMFQFFNDDTKYQTMWNQMVKELDHNELRSMLILFTGSTELTCRKIYLSISNLQNCVPGNEYNNDKIYPCDLEIHTCFYSGSINNSLFASQETLNQLRIYFSNDEDIINEKDD